MSDAFDRWWQKDDRQGFAFERITLQGFAEENMRKAWNARQPEIDALNARIERMEGQRKIEEAATDAAIAQIERLKAENERLKALHDSLAEENRRLWLKAQDALVENERLRKDAERYKFVRRNTTGIISRLTFIVREMDREHAIDAAMKNFSTTLPDTKGE